MHTARFLKRRDFLRCAGASCGIGAAAAWLAGCAQAPAERASGGVREAAGDRSRPAEAGPVETGPVETGPVEEAEPEAASGLRLGLDTYSMHQTLSSENPALRKDILWLVDQLDDLKLSGLQIDPSHYPEGGDDVLDRLEERVRAKGYYVEFGMGGWDVRRLGERLQLTARFGGRAVRTFCGDQSTSRADLKRYMEYAVPAFRHAAGVADAYGVDIAVENHGDFTSGELKELIERVDHPRVGVCLDTGNSLFRQEDPLDCARRLAPHVRSMHLKDWTVRYEPDGSMRWTEAVPGAGQVPVLEILEVVAAFRRDVYVALESPVAPSPVESETVSREWRHVKASAAAARRLIEKV